MVSLDTLKPMDDEQKSRLDWLKFGGIDDIIKAFKEDLCVDKNNDRLKEKYKWYVKYYWEKAQSRDYRSDLYLIDRFTDLLELWKKILWPEDKDYYKDSLNEAFLNEEYPWYWWNRIIPKLLEMDILWNDDVEYCSKLLEKAIKKSKEMPKDILNWYTDWSGYVIPWLLKKNILPKVKRKQIFNEQLSRCFENGSSYLRGRSFANMLQVDDMFDKNNEEDVKCYKDMLHKAIEISKRSKNVDYIENILVWLLRLWLRLNMIKSEEIKDEYKGILDKEFEISKTDWHHLRYSIPALLSLEILNKNDENDTEYVSKLKKLIPSDWVELSIWNQYICPQLEKY